MHGVITSGGEAHLFGRRDISLKRKWCLSGPVTNRSQKGEKNYSNGRKRCEGMRATQKTLKVIYCGLFSGSFTAGCSTSRLTEIMIDLMYVLNTRPHILLHDCS